jgi:uncharacterized protein YndB with AHSA1/START domain
MRGTFIAKATIIIGASPSKVWEALTAPSSIKQYLFGTEVTTDWKVGSSIIYRGQWEGKNYEDKGKILQFEPGKRLVSTYWSSLTGASDIPENYKTVCYDLSAEDDATRLTVTQDNNSTQEEADHSAQNWKTVLTTLKKLLEN